MPDVMSRRLRMEPRAGARAQARTRISPAAIQGLEVLSLPIARLDEYVRDLVERNPLLDFDYSRSSLRFEEFPSEDAPSSSATASLDEGDPLEAAPFSDQAVRRAQAEEAMLADAVDASSAPSDAAAQAAVGERFGSGDSFPSSFDRLGAPVRCRSGCSGAGADAAFDWDRLCDPTSQAETLQSDLRLQLASKGIAPEDRALLDAIVDSIDDAGYFAGSMPSLCAGLGRAPEAGERLLALVQTCSPAGVGARTLAECLLLQLPDNAPHAPVIRDLLRNGLDDLAENRTTKLTRAYHVTLDDLAVIRRVIAQLNPRPGSAFAQRPDTAYVIPDLSILREGAGFSVRVTGELGETLVMNDTYRAMLAPAADAAPGGGSRRGAAGEVREWLDERRDEAETALANIDQRRRTLHRFGTYLVEAQYDFFCAGQAHMRPLTMQQAADALGVHVSTVSRTVQDKHVLTPWGVVPLKGFFTSSVACERDDRAGALSSLAVKDRIRAIVAAEDCRHPFSDASITKILNGEGVDISRRTVAKYREAVGIGNQAQRRR